MSRDLVFNLAAFCGLLRESGLTIGPAEGADGLRALTLLEVADRRTFYLGLRSTLIKRREDFDAYDAAFRTFFDGEAPAVRERYRRGSDDETEGGLGGGYSPLSRLLDADLATLGADGQREVALAARRLGRRLALRLGRRLRRAPRGRRIDLRTTARLALRRGGAPAALRYARRRPRPARLLLLLDVSGSMEPYSRTLFQFVYALQSGSRRAESYCFATGLCRVTEELTGGYALAAERARRKVEGWGGGTRIGAALAALTERPVGRRTAVIILSDGLDTGDPGLVGQSMDRLRRRAGRVIWLNPLAGDPRYQPLARAMAAALPHLDVLAPGHSLASLLRLEHFLGRGRP